MKKGHSEQLTPHLLAEIKALEALGDNDIDLSDIPEVTDWSGAVRGKYYRSGERAEYISEQTMAQPKRIPLPEPVARIFQAAADLEQRYPGRRFTPDGHMVGSLGEVIAAEALGLSLYSASHPGHDAHDNEGGEVQIKMTGGRSVAMYSESVRLVVLRIVSPVEAEIVYDGPGRPAWNNARPMAKNGQRVITLSKLRALAAA